MVGLEHRPEEGREQTQQGLSRFDRPVEGDAHPGAFRLEGPFAAPVEVPLRAKREPVRRPRFGDREGPVERVGKPTASAKAHAPADPSALARPRAPRSRGRPTATSAADPRGRRARRRPPGACPARATASSSDSRGCPIGAPGSAESLSRRPGNARRSQVLSVPSLPGPGKAELPPRECVTTGQAARQTIRRRHPSGKGSIPCASSSRLCSAGDPRRDRGGLYAWARSSKGDKDGPKMVTVEQGSITEKAIAVGQIQPRQKFPVKSKISGIVRRCLVSVGDEVRAGRRPLRDRAGPDPAGADGRRPAARLARTPPSSGRRRTTSAPSSSRRRACFPNRTSIPSAKRSSSRRSPWRAPNRGGT